MSASFRVCRMSRSTGPLSASPIPSRIPSPLLGLRSSGHWLSRGDGLGVGRNLLLLVLVGVFVLARGGRRREADDWLIDDRRKIHKDAPAGCAEYRPGRTFQHPKKHEASANLPMPNRSNSKSYTCLGADILYTAKAHGPHVGSVHFTLVGFGSKLTWTTSPGWVRPHPAPTGRSVRLALAGPVPQPDPPSWHQPPHPAASLPESGAGAALPLAAAPGFRETPDLSACLDRFVSPVVLGRRACLGLE